MICLLKLSSCAFVSYLPLTNYSFLSKMLPLSFVTARSVLLLQPAEAYHARSISRFPNNQFQNSIVLPVRPHPCYPAKSFLYCIVIKGNYTIRAQFHGSANNKAKNRRLHGSRDPNFRQAYLM